MINLQIFNNIEGKNKGIILLKFIAALFITYSHMAILFPRFQGLVTGGAIGDGLFFFCSGFTLFLGRDDGFINWYKRRISRIYPTIIMWAIFSSIVFMWNWSITDIITTPRYWFIPCIMIYYAIFYIIRKYMFKHLKVAFLIAAAIVVVSYFMILDLNASIMYADVSFMRIYYFLFMLLGAMTALQKEKMISPKKSLTYILLSLICYYTCMGIYKISPFYCKFQIISLIPLLISIYWMYQFCNSPKVYVILQSKIGKVFNFISCLTLEIYMVQYAVFTDKLNYLFPLNLVIIYLIIFIIAYILKCLSNIFSQIFRDKAFDYKAIYKL